MGAKKTKAVRLLRHDAGDARLLNRRQYTMQVDKPVLDVVPVVTHGGSLLSVDYTRAEQGEVTLRFSDKVTSLRAVLYTVAG